jgi:aspartate 1-decarboxylase
MNINNGARFETYVIEEKARSGVIGLYGAAAHLGKTGDLVIILSYGLVEDKKARGVRLKVVQVDSRNRPVK